MIVDGLTNDIAAVQQLPKFALQIYEKSPVKDVEILLNYLTEQQLAAKVRLNKLGQRGYLIPVPPVPGRPGRFRCHYKPAEAAQPGRAVETNICHSIWRQLSTRSIKVVS